MDAPFDPDPDLSSDWISDMVNDAPGDAVLDSTARNPGQANISFEDPSSPQQGDFNDSNERESYTIPEIDQQDTGQGCKCTNQLLAIIPELENNSMGRARIAVEGVLRLTRRGSSAISTHLDCHHYAPTGLTPTFMLTCVLVLVQVGACYTFLRRSLENPEWQKHLPVSVGDLAIEEGETRQRIMHAVLDAEICHTVALSNKLEEWGGQVQKGRNPLPWEPLLSFARQELDRALDQQRRV